jgi:general secretion pathway protein D
MPVLGRLFSSHKDDSSKTEIMLSITPRIVGSGRLRDAGEVEYWAGTESALRSSPFNMKPLGSVAIDTFAAAKPVMNMRSTAKPIRNVAPAPQSMPETGAVVLSWQGPAEAKPGEVINLTLNAQSSQAVSRMDLLVSFDPAVLKALDVTEGGVLKRDNLQSTFVKTIDQAGGQILVDMSGAQPDGASGTGSVVTLVFETLSAHPQSSIVVGRMLPSGPGGEELAVALPEPHLLTVSP